MWWKSAKRQRAGVVVDSTEAIVDVAGAMGYMWLVAWS